MNFVAPRWVLFLWKHPPWPWQKKLSCASSLRKELQKRLQPMKHVRKPISRVSGTRQALFIEAHRLLKYTETGTISRTNSLSKQGRRDHAFVVSHYYSYRVPNVFPHISIFFIITFLFLSTGYF